MPRRRSPPRLYLDPERKQWIIRDGATQIRTYKPERSPCPLVAEVLHIYSSEHLPDTHASKNGGYNISNLGAWWGDKRTSDVTPKNCKAYAGSKTPAAARRDLETLRAALNYWHKHYGPLAVVPAFPLPPKPEPRDIWLTRKHVARLLWVARHTQHLKRFILLGIYTGSRSGTILSLRWDWIDLAAGIMRRKDSRVAETKKRKPPVRLGRRILARRNAHPCIRKTFTRISEKGSGSLAFPYRNCTENPRKVVGVAGFEPATPSSRTL
jgi:hypothetical protein